MSALESFDNENREHDASMESGSNDHVNESTPLVLEKQTRGEGALALIFPFNFFPFLVNLNFHFGWKLLVLLFASQHVVKGFVPHFIGPASQYLLASFNIEGPRMQVFGGIIGLPWAMKPILGLVSDCFPIYGFNKGPYILLFSGVGVLSCLLVSQDWGMPVEFTVFCLFCMTLQFSACDLLTEAKYAEKMQTRPAHGPDLMAYVWFGLQCGGLVATMLVGPTMKHFGNRAVYLGALLPMASIVYPVAKNFLEEREQSDEEVSEARRKMFEQKEACFLCIAMFVGTLFLTFLGLKFENVYLNCAASLMVALFMLVAFSVTLRPVIAKVNAFFLLQTSLSFSIGGASFYFYTDTPDKYAAGPHFSKEFFTSVLGTLGAICSLFGIYSYQKYMREWKYINLLLMTNLVLSALSVLDVIMFSRLNVKWGIDDHLFVMGKGMFETVISQWQWMPAVVILSQLCPKGMEATMYALLAGCHNLGNTIASNTGAVALDLLGCKPSGALNEDHQFDRLWIGSMLSTILPMFTLLLLPWLIPDAKQTDKLLDDGDRDATTGSLWRRWTGQ